MCDVVLYVHVDAFKGQMKALGTGVTGGRKGACCGSEV